MQIVAPFSFTGPPFQVEMLDYLWAIQNEMFLYLVTTYKKDTYLYIYSYIADCIESSSICRLCDRTCFDLGMNQICKGSVFKQLELGMVFRQKL